MSGGIGLQQVSLVPNASGADQNTFKRVILVDVNGNPLTPLTKGVEKAPYWDANGDQQLMDYIRNKPFTMGVTAAVPGDLAVVVSSQTCRYDKIGDFVDVSIVIAFTPTYTTASGNAIFTGMPFPADTDTSTNLIPVGQGNSFVWPSTATTIYFNPQGGTTNAIILGTKSGAVAIGLAITAFTSGQAYTLRFRGRYRTARV